MKKKVILISCLIASCFALSSCETVSPQEQLYRDKEQCREYGYTDNNKLADCVAKIQSDRSDKKFIEDRDWNRKYNNF